jgi:hypothetical protein
VLCVSDRDDLWSKLATIAAFVKSRRETLDAKKTAHFAGKYPFIRELRLQIRGAFVIAPKLGAMDHAQLPQRPPRERGTRGGGGGSSAPPLASSVAAAASSALDGVDGRVAEEGGMGVSLGRGASAPSRARGEKRPLSPGALTTVKTSPYALDRAPHPVNVEPYTTHPKP